MPSFRHFLHTQLVLKIPEPTASFASKTAIVTGANGGFGREIIKHLIRLEASKIICACRSVSKGEEVKREIEAVSKCNPDIIEVWPLDLESPSSIKAFVERANALSRLDVLINLAGVLCVNFSIVYDTERTMAVNAIGTFLLAVQMIPKLKETARKYSVTPHMTFVASALYDVAKYPEDPGDDIFAYFKDEKNFAAQNQSVAFRLISTKCALIIPSANGEIDITSRNYSSSTRLSNSAPLSIPLIRKIRPPS
ncbi:NAD(P)-binding protein [Cryphonectria parasitica EP155]|uniref:NAD(P)-binding protein n=1 Tax=Cryphonectria parasitica (strain ATCC 38755 / EP155) TaxID=660469 RepID=A0A9P5CTS8_CRYP1|nr:NAD(P)-binding protein [Cryphonectria parasitica EP155]KAF3769430.1 NAD(P)-binding protein [Cryphonectria parasitica EP155]